MLRTKVVCTLGPASSDHDTVLAMVQAGMNLARVNMSHGSREDHARTVKSVREAARKTGKPVAILVDLQGPKIRVGELTQPLELNPGDEVVVRDPRQRKAGGRTPYRQPYTEPALVLEVHGNKCSVKLKDGTVLKNIHLEDVISVPESARNLEKDPLIFDEEENQLYLDSDARRSPGEMLEDQGKSVEKHNEQLQKDRKISPGKIGRILAGNFIAYAVESRTKVCTIGKVTAVSDTEGTVIVHRYRPTNDNRLRIYWKPVFIEGGVEVLGQGSSPSTETVAAKRIIFPVQLMDGGVLSHATARELDHRKYRFDKPPGEIADENWNVLIRESPQVKAADGESITRKVEKFCMVGQAYPSFEDNETSHVVHFQARTELQKWLSLGYVDFAEVFRGFGQFTIRVREVGCSAAEGFDKYALTYERAWHLETKKDQADCAWLLVSVSYTHLTLPTNREV